MHVADTNPYPWPYDGGLEFGHVVLVICGAQNALVQASSNAPAVLQRLGQVAESVRRCGGDVVWVRHGTRTSPARATASLPIRATSGWALWPRPEPDDFVIDSGGWDGCFSSDLDHTLRTFHAPRVVLGGFASEITVDSTVRTLNDRGHECLVLTDGCAPLDPHLGERAHASLTMSGGIFGALGEAELLLAALDVVASTTPANHFAVLEKETFP